MKLSKQDWNQLDILLGKIGFGGYCDLVELLKIVIKNLNYNNPKLEKKIEIEVDIHNLVHLIIRIQRRLK